MALGTGAGCARWAAEAHSVRVRYADLALTMLACVGVTSVNHEHRLVAELPASYACHLRPRPQTRSRLLPSCSPLCCSRTHTRTSFQ